MPQLEKGRQSNLILAGLPRQERERVLAECVLKELALGEILCEQNQNYREVYFPTSGYVSLATTIPGRAPLGMAIIGHEGMLGATLILGVPISPFSARVLGSGGFWRMRALDLQRVLRECKQLRRDLGHHLHALQLQFMLTAGCTAFHEVRCRLARSLLMSQDHTQSRQIGLTHQLLADLLGVQRSAITIAAGVLQDDALIDCSRGAITILDRAGLEAAACVCYASQRLYTPRVV